MLSTTLERQISERERRGVGVSTAERVRQAGEDRIDLLPDSRQRIAQALLDQLRSRRIIAEREWLAGDRYREDAYQAGAIWSAAMPLEPSDRRAGSGVPVFARSDMAADAMRRHIAAAQSLAGGLQQVADYVCLAPAGGTLAELGRLFYGRTDTRTAAVAGKTLALLMLNTLVEHYEL